MAAVSMEVEMVGGEKVNREEGAKEDSEVGVEEVVEG